jgi:hypothetical protein
MTYMTEEDRKQLDLAHAVMGITDTEQYSDVAMNAVRDPRTGRLVGLDGAEWNDNGLVVHFFVEPELNKLETFLAKRPIYSDVEMVQITPAGAAGRNLQVTSPVTAYYKWRFERDYNNWKQGRSAQESGTPLSALTGMSPALVKELERFHVHTVEQLATLPDNNASAIRGFHAHKAKAKQFLEAMNTAVPAQALQDELAKRDAQIAALMAEVQAMREADEAPEDDDAPKKPKMRFGKPIKE